MLVGITGILFKIRLNFNNKLGLGIPVTLMGVYETHAYYTGVH